ncbi:MAG TPA: sigma-70 family RNA polymerase sigma factor [Chloroflexaceae bacterium]|nr:sigma-70 family RNA polymerase sigma factor [Chloroflexaceae bacterium]
MEPSDEVLIGACRRGDESAWDILVDRYKRLIFAIARRAGLDEELSADVLQRVFTILVERLDTIEQPARLSAWLTGIARREAWRARRREHVAARVAGVGIESLATLEDRGDLPDAVVLRIESQHQLRRALAALDGRCRELLTLLFLTPDPPSYAEIAATLGVSLGTIGPTRARCLKKLRELLPDDL